MFIKRIPLRGVFVVGPKSFVGDTNFSEILFDRINRAIGGRYGLNELHFAEDLKVAQWNMHLHGLNLAVFIHSVRNIPLLAALASAGAEDEWERIAAAGRLRARGRFDHVAMN